MMTREQAEGFIQAYEDKREKLLKETNAYYRASYTALVISRILELERENNIFSDRAFYADELIYCESLMEKKEKMAKKLGLGAKKFEALKQIATEEFKKFQKTIGDCGD